MFLLDHTYLSNMPHNIQYVKRAEYLKDSGDVDLSLDHHVIFFFFFFLVGTQLQVCEMEK